MQYMKRFNNFILNNKLPLKGKKKLKLFINEEQYFSLSIELF
jgi:hypothetical protein